MGRLRSRSGPGPRSSSRRARLQLALGALGLLISSGALAEAGDPQRAPVAEEPRAAEGAAAPGTAGPAPGAPDPLFDDYFGDGFGDDFDAQPSSYPDPLESTNRGVFAFNRQLDKWILDPVTEAYRFVVPKLARDAVSRFFLNLGSTKTLVNDFLQLEWRDAGVTTGRLVVNSTVGIGGLFDVAEMIGLERHESDFGQTLALAGTPSGPYLVLPILGPANVRDGTGLVIDGFFQPTYYILGPADLLIGPSEVFLYGGTSGLSTRERHYAELKALEDSSIDFYAAMRSGYYQDRVAAIWGRRDGHRTREEPVFGGGKADPGQAEPDAD